MRRQLGWASFGGLDPAPDRVPLLRGVVTTALGVALAALGLALSLLFLLYFTGFGFALDALLG